MAAARRLRPLLALCLLAPALAAGGQDARTDDPTRGQTRLGSLITDAMLAGTGADAALLPASLLLKGKAAGDAPTEGELRLLLVDPDEPCVVLELTGGEMRGVLEKSVSVYPRSNTGFLQVSGLAFRFKRSARRGQRLTEVRVKGKPLADDKPYKIAMPQSLARGAEGYLEGKSLPEKRSESMTLVNLVKRYLERRPAPGDDARRIQGQ